MRSTILVVDDNKYIVEGLIAILHRNGYETMAAYSGEETLEILERAIPNLILLDISMEPMDGWETLQKARKKPESAHIPVIVFSARRTLTDEASRMQLGVAEAIQKPINIGVLLDSIDRVLKKKAGGLHRVAADEVAGFHINLGFDRHITEQ